MLNVDMDKVKSIGKAGLGGGSVVAIFLMLHGDIKAEIKNALGRVESNTNAIGKIREERAGDKSSIKAIHEDVKIIKTLLLQRK